MSSESVIEVPVAAPPTAAAAAVEEAPASPAAAAAAPAGIELVLARPDAVADGAAAAAASHYERSSILRANPGDVIARVAPDLAATALGDGVRLDADGVSVIATAAGRVVVDSDARRISIAKSLEIPGHVDFATGHVDFPHDVTVAGNVADLFRVHAGGRLEVRGVIEGADVRAGGGLLAAGGVSGKNKGRVAVDGDLDAKYLANTTVAATGNVKALTVVNSRVVCGGALAVTDGPILAGHVTATGGVRCEVAGSTAGVKTVVEAAVDEGLRAAAAAKIPEIEALRRNAGKIRETVQPLMQNQKKLNAQQKERATELLFEADGFEQEAEQLLAGLRKLAEDVAARANFEIVVNQTLYAGVVVRFPGVYAVIDDPLQGPIRISTKTMHKETRIVMHYGAGKAAHALLTHADPDVHTDALQKLLTPPAPSPAK